MIKIAIAVAFALAATLTHHALAADPQRQAEVARRSKDVMPFSLDATTHLFTKTAEGGIQRVVAKSLADAGQAKLVRLHLQEIQQQFLGGDFSGPAHIHGKNMPGLQELGAAGQDRIAIDYREVDGGAELTYRTSSPMQVAALHRWFDAQLSDHGKDAMEGHSHQH